jgi:hypothetical protein
MKFSTVAILSGLTAAVSADFGVIVTRSGSPIHLQELNATGNAFYIGKPTTTYCPEGVSGLKCPVGKGETLFAGGHETLGLSTQVPGGQQIYVAKDGTVGYTQAHSASIPAGASLTGWSKTEGKTFGQLSYKYGLIFCPVGGDSHAYKLFAQVPGVSFIATCLGGNLLTVNGTAPGAWQYA